MLKNWQQNIILALLGILALIQVYRVLGTLHYAPVDQCHAECGQQSATGEDAENKERIGFWKRTFEDPVSFYTLVLAGFTGILGLGTLGLWYVTLQAARSTRDAVELGREEFVSSHRPHLRVRNVVVHKQSSPGFHAEIFAPRRLVMGQIYITNIGDTAATVMDAHCEVFITTTNLPMERPYEGKDGNSSFRSRIESGASVPLPFSSESEISTQQSDDIQSGGNHLAYVLGWIEYSDDRSVARRTAFCRLYDFETGRFSVIDDADYEHEE